MILKFYKALKAGGGFRFARQLYGKNSSHDESLRSEVMKEKLDHANF